MKSKGFEVWVIGLTKSIKSRYTLNLTMNLDNRKLINSFFTLLCIKCDEGDFMNLQGAWISNLHNLKIYKMWNNLECLDNFIILFGAQIEHRKKKEIVLQVPPKKQHIYEYLYNKIYLKLKSSFDINKVFNINPKELLLLKKIERHHQAKLVFLSSHRYEKYNKYWKRTKEDLINGESYIINDNIEIVEEENI